MHIELSDNLLYTVAHNCHAKRKRFTPKEKNLKPKEKGSCQKKKTSRQKKNGHAKRKKFTPKEKASRQKINLQIAPKLDGLLKTQ